jgi:hypothetical protein
LMTTLAKVQRHRVINADGVVFIITDNALRNLAVEAVGYLANGRHFTKFKQLARIPSKRAGLGLAFVASLGCERFHEQRFPEWLRLCAPARIAALSGFEWHCSECLSV